MREEGRKKRIKMDGSITKEIASHFKSLERLIIIVIIISRQNIYRRERERYGVNECMRERPRERWRDRSRERGRKRQNIREKSKPVNV